MIPEILAPAGSMEALKAAVHAGADAVYLGGSSFSARAYANNFDESALLEAIKYCHIYGVKVYLTINTLFRNEEILTLYDYLAPLYTAGLDAVIVQDLGVVSCVHEHFPELPIHASTQMTITTGYAHELLKDHGVTRIVPARELSIEEIRELKTDGMKPEVEVFVQGALCYCYSGQCLMSSMLGGRSGNRGRCAQTCRLPCQAFPADGKIADRESSHFLSLKDLCGLETVPELIEAGVDSFKIEGRMKRPEYVAACVRAYRRVVDAWKVSVITKELIEECRQDMAEVFNRGGFTRGYFHQKNGMDMIFAENPGNTGVTIGTVERMQESRILIKLSRDVFKGDILELKMEKEPVILTCNVDGRTGSYISLNVPKKQRFYKGQQVNRMFCSPLMHELEKYSSVDKMIPIWGKVELQTGENAKLTLGMKAGDKEYSIVQTGIPVETAVSNPVTEDVVLSKIGRMGNTRYFFENLEITVSEDAFYPLKSLKELRRNAVKSLEDAVLAASRRDLPNVEFGKVNLYSDGSRNERQEYTLTAMVSNGNQYRFLREDKRVTDIYLDLQYFDKEEVLQIMSEDTSCYLALPPVLRKSSLMELKELSLSEIPGILIRNLDELAYLNHFDYRGKILTDYSLYAMNDLAAGFIRSLYPEARITIPVELNRKQIAKLGYAGDNCELNIYGYQQLMVSTQCIQETLHGCTKGNHGFTLRDRMGKDFYVYCNCKYCYNLIYNSVPTVLFDGAEGNEGYFSHGRLHFIREDEAQMSKVLDAVFSKKVLEIEKTRGHYKRGVE